jgi:hypothetical protein
VRNPGDLKRPESGTHFSTAGFRKNGWRKSNERFVPCQFNRWRGGTIPSGRNCSLRARSQIKTPLDGGGYELLQRQEISGVS